MGKKKRCNERTGRAIESADINFGNALINLPEEIPKGLNIFRGFFCDNFSQ